MSTNEISFKLHSIKTEQFAIIEDIYSETDPVQLESNYRFGSVVAEKLVAVLVNYKFKTPKGVFLTIEVSCMFGIKPDSWDSIYNGEKLELILPKVIATHLLVLVIGTTRGVLHAKTENTPYNRFFLPTLNVSENIKEDIVISE
jgi:hypothetical protein